MRSTTLQTLMELANEGVDLHFLTADLGFKILDPFREAHPTRFTNAGVSEANMISVAAGLALAGKRPVCYSMVPFLFMRAFEQVRLDVVAPRLNVLLVGVGGGLSYGHEGMSHHAIEDLAMARALPGLRVIAPGDPHEAAAAVRLALTEPGPTFLRLGRNGDPKLHDGPVIDLRRPSMVRHGKDNVVVLATGHILADAMKATELLAREHGTHVRLVSIPLVKPFDDDYIRGLAKSARAIFTVEEHSIINGFGTLVAEILFEERFGGVFRKIGLPDAYCNTHGTHDWLRTFYGLDPEGIARTIMEHLPR